MRKNIKKSRVLNLLPKKEDSSAYMEYGKNSKNHRCFKFEYQTGLPIKRDSWSYTKKY